MFLYKNVCSEAGMVIEYLEKIRFELAQDRIKLKKEQDNAEIKLKENMKFIERLKEEDEQNFDAFSPRKQNFSLREEIKQLEEERLHLLDEFTLKKNLLVSIDSKFCELNSVLKIAKQQEAADKQIMDQNLKNDEFFKLKLLETQENERQRIARELHDSSVQSLTSLVHKTELCSKLVDLDLIRCKLELSSMSKVIRKIIEEMRQMIYDLRPMSFDDIGFDITVERELIKIQNQGICTNYSVEGEVYEINPVITLTLLRVIQEACNNAVKHANPTMISVKIYYETDGIEIIVEDDGIGFEVEEQTNEIREDYTGFGLSTMKERIYLLSGQMKIESKVGVGTKIIIDVPTINKEEEVNDN